MDKKELFEFYEKLYFHEIEYRDKITARLQLPLAIYISFLSLLGFMVRNINFACKNGYLILFGFFFILSSALLLVGIIYFIKAFYGHTYEFIPTANASEAYRKKLDSTYEVKWTGFFGPVVKSQNLCYWKEKEVRKCGRVSVQNLWQRLPWQRSRAI